MHDITRSVGGAATGDLCPRRADRCGIELRCQPHIHLRDRERGRLRDFEALEKPRNCRLGRARFLLQILSKVS
jgi:hypothetical protein